MNESVQRSYAPGQIPVWTFSDKIRKAREVAGLNQVAFADRIGVTASSLAAYETGRSHPRFRDAPVIAKSIQMLTGIPYEWFLIDDAPEDPRPSGPNKVTSDYSSDVWAKITQLSEFKVRASA